MARSSKAGGKRSARKARNPSSAKGRKRPEPKRTAGLKRSTSSDLELKAARDQQAATAEILKIIASSPSDVQPVFEAIASSANRLVGGVAAGVYRFIDGLVHLVAFSTTNPAGEAALRALFPRPIEDHFGIVEAGEVFQVAETENEEKPRLRIIARQRGFRSIIYVPLRSAGASIGAIAVSRKEPGVFATRQVELLQTFADQAVIAIENARLFNETREALERQTATSDVLKIISRSSVELEMVLDTLVQAVARLCRADQVYMFHLRHDLWHLIADYGLSAEARAFFQTHPFTPGRGSTSGRAAMEGRAVSITDVLHDPEYTLSEGQAIAGYRSTLGVPLFRENTLIGVFSIVRTRVDPFTNKEIELASTFAD